MDRLMWVLLAVFGALAPAAIMGATGRGAHDHRDTIHGFREPVADRDAERVRAELRTAADRTRTRGQTRDRP
ncbi:hypothetical protein QMK19_24585 [Streptomyces sp. H10-C2]|uniref:hypothetical protein n=1 Tax=unclassified Streptomyces TaxID=2593676 RepID=UPI0024B9E95C|nr:MULTISPECIES: hypothetical protein [unclassified Streptomyces]MDJ0343068.1 hypothetical protein [Streptomyces sp. PH10-H1]MDJ0372752.1 hypothetical protein [Streptomyces sp. H10-C2]